MLDALNKRLGTKNLQVGEIAAVAASRNMSLQEVIAMPELSTYEYNTLYHDGPSLVCSSFIAEMWNKAGLFNGHHINPGEFSPKDIYEVKFFDNNFKHPPEC